MNKAIANQLLDIVMAVRELPDETQEQLVHEIADRVSVYTRPRLTKVYRVNDDERAALERSAEDVRHNRFATDQEVEALFARFR